MSAVKTTVNVCPFEGCVCEFKGLKTLFNHYSRFHNDNDKTAMKLYDAWLRQLNTKPKSKTVKIPAVQSNVTELTLEEMKCGLLQLINEATPCLSSSPNPSNLPMPSFVQVVQSSDELTIDDMLTEMIDELNIDATETETEPIETETEPECDYDRGMIECCFKMYEGGFVKAYRMLKRRDVSYAVNPYDDLTDTKDHLELVFNALCDAWYDFSRSDDFDADTHADMFDDDADWLDVCGLLITHENIKEFY